jgi:ATP-binding cassette subfamily B protein/subfamily B ATP-binding cassette protein MsbA
MITIEEEKLGKIYDSRIIKRLMSYLQRDGWMLVVAALLGLVLMGGQIALPVITQRAIDRHIRANARLLYLSADQAGKHQGVVYSVQDSLYAVPQEYLSKIEPRRFADSRNYYLMDKVKAEKKGIEGYKTAGDAKLLVPYEELSKFETSLLNFLRSADWQGVIRLGILFLGIVLIRFVASFAQVFLTTVAGQRAMHRLRMGIFKHLQRLPVQFFDRNPVGRLVTRATNDVEALNGFFSEVVTSFFYDAFLLLGLIIYLPIYNWRLALVTFAIVPPMLAATVIFRRKLRDAFRKVRVRLAKINAFLAENLSGIKVVQMFHQERKRLGKFNQINESHFRARFSQMMIFAVFRPLVDLLAITSMVAIIWFGAGWVFSGLVTIGLLTAFISFAERFFEPIRDLTEKFNVLQQAMASGERVFMLLDEKQEKYEGKVKPARVEGAIEFRDLWFAYNDEDWVLKDINFKIKPGERIAFVGATGAGKTSIINTLCRFYETQKGKILLDGIDIKDIDKSALRSKIGIVMQDVFLFLGDIKTNIKLRSDIPREKVEEAARVANAAQFISKLPEGYNAPVQERGVNLSVGERQLIAFARALAFDPAILILDEATSSVDTKTEALIQDAIHKLLQGRTALIIAHRLSTVKDADRIIVLDHGHIVEDGDHTSLMAQKGAYYNLYKLQFEHNV